MDGKNLVVLSDSTGETADQIVHAVIVQFELEDLNIYRYSDVCTKDRVDEIINDLTGENLIFATIIEEDIMEHLLIKAKERNIDIVDLLEVPLLASEKFFEQKAKRQVGLTRQLTKNYFGKIEALEFAVKYDDCKDYRGIKRADIVIIGVSRTSKTPVSLNLAFKNYKVANIPLVPEIEPPNALFEVPEDRVIGLIIDPEKLNRIRQQRLREMGISSDVPYSDDERIHEELKYAIKIMEKIGCRIIDVSEKTIEETSTLIAEMIDSDKEA